MTEYMNVNYTSFQSIPLLVDRLNRAPFMRVAGANFAFVGADQADSTAPTILYYTVDNRHEIMTQLHFMALRIGDRVEEGFKPLCLIKAHLHSVVVPDTLLLTCRISETKR